MNIVNYIYEFEINTRDAKKYADFLWGVVDVLGTKPVGMNIQWYPEEGGLGGFGPTAFITFIESYVALDTWPENNYGHLSIVSCKGFNKEELEKYIKEFWGVEKITKTHKVFDRS